MRHLLYEYDLSPTTWVYLSSLLMIAIYFKFSRFWSVRNLDLIGLIALAPGLLLVEKGLAMQASVNGAANETATLLSQAGYVWLFAIGVFFLVRFLIDPLMVRRPLLEPNLSPGGLAFIGASLLLFLLVNVITNEPTKADMEGARRLDQMLSREKATPHETNLESHGPGFPIIYIFSTPARALVTTDEELPEPVQRQALYMVIARTMAILSHLAVVIGMVVIGARHFENLRMGIAAATLYLMLPYTAQMTGRVDHALMAALLTWAVATYRMPAVAGIFLGLAAGSLYYPLFLLPLWCSFYWQRGLRRFLIGFTCTLAALVGSLALTSDDLGSFFIQARQMLGWTSLAMEGVSGFWGSHPALAPYRIPALALFGVALSVSFALWPAQKNLGTLLSCSAAVMLGTQFWKAHDGGLYVAWYLPLMLLTIFRPNLEDRVAIATLGQGWFVRRRAQEQTKAA